MPEAIYDQHAEFYLDFVEQKLAEGQDGFFHMHVARLRSLLGVFAFSILHPCFGGSPFRLPAQSPFVTDENGEPSAYLIHRYATEGYWNSGGTGVRGHMGAYHRTLATYINDLIRCGFALEYLEEPLIAKIGLNAEIPLTLIVIGVLR